MVTITFLKISGLEHLMQLFSLSARFWDAGHVVEFTTVEVRGQ